jgi:N-acyl-D-aspartate/D-glutamate deacylase
MTMPGPDCADILIQGGMIIDGLGSEAFPADVLIAGDRIVAVEPSIDCRADRYIDASGCIVTPGFIDVHTHYDGQAIWSQRLSPSSSHGVTTVVMGNCGVGFAPCRDEDHDRLVSVMEGVEDIPEIVMTSGLRWAWRSFPEYLNVLEAGQRDIDAAAYVPHSALRVYAMGERGAARKPATPEDLSCMANQMEEALAAGALGFSTASVPVHRTSTGAYTPSFGAAEAELMAIATAIRRAGHGIMQVLVDFSNGDPAIHIDLLKKLARTTGRLVTFTLAQIDSRPELWRTILALLEAANREVDVMIRAQVFPRPVGMLLGHELSLNPFTLCPSYAPLAALPLQRKLLELRKPDVRHRLLSELPEQPKQPLAVMARNFEHIFPLGDPPVYEPARNASIAAQALVRHLAPEELAYDLLLEKAGRAMLLSTLANYADYSLDSTFDMLTHPQCLPGLGDGGAHYGMICDASFPTYMLTHWTRDREGAKLSITQAIASLTRQPAEAFGFKDRGVIAPRAKADINVIDYDHLALHVPQVCDDLPAGGKRLDQRASGYRATICSGQLIVHDDVPTGATPGKVIRTRSSSA